LPQSPSQPRSEISFSRKLAWRLETLAYDSVSLLLRLLPFRLASKLGSCLLRLIGPLSSKHKIAKTGIDIAFPDLSETERARILRDQWGNLGRTFAEFPLMHRIKAFAPGSRVSITGIEHLERHHPAILISGHFANWEVMATVLTQSSQTVRITYRKLNNPYMDARIINQRQKYGTKFLVQKSTHRGGRELFLALQNNEGIAILNDQKFNEGIALPFFGTETMTNLKLRESAKRMSKPAWGKFWILPKVIFAPIPASGSGRIGAGPNITINPRKRSNARRRATVLKALGQDCGYAISTASTDAGLSSARASLSLRFAHPV